MTLLDQLLASPGTTHAVKVTSLRLSLLIDPATLSVEGRKDQFQELKAAGQIPYQRARSKQEKDSQRQEVHEDETVRRYVEGEKRFLEGTAYRDDVPGSLGRGDVVALFNSPGLDVNEGDVMRNAKLRYVHPSFRRFARKAEFEITDLWADDVRAEM